MNARVRMISVGAMIAVLSCGFFFSASNGDDDQNSRIGSDDPPSSIMREIDSIADALRNGDKKIARELATAMAEREEEVYYIMLTLRRRQKKAFGVGKPGQVFPDGIQQFIGTIAKTGVRPNDLKKNAQALEKMSYRLAAIAEVTHQKAVIVRKNARFVNGWRRITSNMRRASHDLVKAIENANADQFNYAAIRVNSSCNNCHNAIRAGAFPVAKKIPPAKKGKKKQKAVKKGKKKR